ncbi:MAG: YvrJ family protein [Bacillus sp. (in: firmicutes)]
MEEIVPLISEAGFPIAVTVYLLYRIETKLNTLIETMQTLPQRLNEERVMRDPH